MQRVIEEISEKEFSEILNNILENVGKIKDWYSFFPRISSYNYMYPNGYEDIEDYPNSFREDDHVFAAAAMKYPMLHDTMVEIVKRITSINKTSGIIWAEPYEHAGTCFAVELALYNSSYVYLYADFLMSNDIEYENLQSYDIIKIIRKWGLIPGTYYLILARWFSQGENARSDMDYLTFSGHSLKKNLQSENKQALIIEALELFLFKQKISSDELSLVKKYQKLFDELIEEYIFPEDKEKSECMKRRFPEVIEKLKNLGFPTETKLSNEIEEHTILNVEDIPEI